MGLKMSDSEGKNRRGRKQQFLYWKTMSRDGTKTALRLSQFNYADRCRN